MARAMKGTNLFIDQSSEGCEPGTFPDPSTKALSNDLDASRPSDSCFRMQLSAPSDTEGISSSIQIAAPFNPSNQSGALNKHQVNSIKANNYLFTKLQKGNLSAGYQHGQRILTRLSQREHSKLNNETSNSDIHSRLRH